MPGGRGGGVRRWVDERSRPVRPGPGSDRVLPAAPAATAAASDGIRPAADRHRARPRADPRDAADRRRRPDAPTTAMPPTGGPYDPGPPYGGGRAGPGGPGGPDEPEFEARAGAVVPPARTAGRADRRRRRPRGRPHRPARVDVRRRRRHRRHAAVGQSTTVVDVRAEPRPTSTTTTTEAGDDHVDRRRHHHDDHHRAGDDDDDDDHDDAPADHHPAPTTTEPPPDTTVPVTAPPLPGATVWDIIAATPSLSEFRDAIEGTSSDRALRHRGRTSPCWRRRTTPSRRLATVDVTDYIIAGELTADEMFELDDVETEGGPSTLAVDRTTPRRVGAGGDAPSRDVEAGNADLTCTSCRSGFASRRRDSGGEGEGDGAGQGAAGDDHPPRPPEVGRGRRRRWRRR